MATLLQGGFALSGSLASMVGPRSWYLDSHTNCLTSTMSSLLRIVFRLPETLLLFACSAFLQTFACWMNHLHDENPALVGWLHFPEVAGQCMDYSAPEQLDVDFEPPLRLESADTHFLAAS
eukprot:1857352-Amphidinium_carterae.2